MGLLARWRARFDRVWRAALRAVMATLGLIGLLYAGRWWIDAYRRALAYAWRSPLPRRNPVLRYVIDLLVFLAAAGALGVLVVALCVILAVLLGGLALAGMVIGGLWVLRYVMADPVYGAVVVTIGLMLWVSGAVRLTLALGFWAAGDSPG
jgi:uncharacterized BrkB/YihY/UPF0761 family membrane protein